MGFPHDRNAAVSRQRRCMVACGLVAASLAVTACGSSDPPTSRSSEFPTILDTEKVERAIEDSSLAQRATHAQVSCPSGVHQKKGLVFSCTAVVKRNSTRFVITQLNGSGRVHYEAR
jgi:hypothetical protein